MTISFIIFIVLLCFGLFGLLNFDRLVKIEYEKHKNHWVKDGKPRGFFWRPSESTMFSSGIATIRVSTYWFFKTPQWIKDNPKAQKTLKKSRIYTFIFNIGIVVWFAISIITINN